MADILRYCMSPGNVTTDFPRLFVPIAALNTLKSTLSTSREHCDGKAAPWRQPRCTTQLCMNASLGLAPVGANNCKAAKARTKTHLNPVPLMQDQCLLACFSLSNRRPTTFASPDLCGTTRRQPGEVGLRQWSPDRPPPAYTGGSPG
jgi:hypothetical protein